MYCSVEKVDLLVFQEYEANTGVKLDGYGCKFMPPQVNININPYHNSPSEMK